MGASGHFTDRALKVFQASFDFVTCRRSDGTYYGNGGATCHKGSEAAIIAELKLDKRIQKLCENQAEQITAISGKPIDVSAKEMQEFYDQVLIEREKILKGDLSQEKIDDFILNSTSHDLSKVEFLIIGQEPKSHPGQDVQVDHLARSLAARTLVNQGKDLEEVSKAIAALDIAEHFDRGGSWKWNSFVAVSANATNKILDEQAEAIKNQAEISKAYFSGKMASLEMSNIAAVSVGDGYTKKGKVDPARSTYGWLKTSREKVEKEYADRRAEVVSNQIKAAINNGKLKGGLAMPGNDPKKWRALQTGVIDRFWNGKSGTESNIRQVKFDMVKNAKGEKKTITSFVVDMGKGKYFTAHNLTFVTQGFQNAEKIAEIRRRAITEAITSNKGYVPNN